MGAFEGSFDFLPSAVAAPLIPFYCSKSEIVWLFQHFVDVLVVVVALVVVAVPAVVVKSGPMHHRRVA